MVNTHAPKSRIPGPAHGAFTFTPERSVGSDFFCGQFGGQGQS